MTSAACAVRRGSARNEKKKVLPWPRAEAAAVAMLETLLWLWRARGTLSETRRTQASSRPQVGRPGPEGEPEDVARELTVEGLEARHRPHGGREDGGSFTLRPGSNHRPGGSRTR